MDEELEEVFPWIPLIKRGFLRSFSGDYEVGTLELLQQNITEEYLKIKCKNDTERGKQLFQCIEYFYFHFCRKWYQWKKFSADMEVVWVHILTSYLKVGLLLSRGKKKSKWINRVLTATMRFPGEKNLIYDALLSVNCLNKKHQPVYGSILMHLLIYASSFVPMIITDPAEYLKLCLLFRRLKLLMKDPSEKSVLQMKASKTLAPPTLSNWLLAHDFNATWMNRTARIDLRINIFKRVGGKESEKKVVETFRKLLLPRIGTERKAELERSCSETDQIAKKRNNDADVTDSFKKQNYIGLAHDDDDDDVSPKDEKEIEATKNEVRNKKLKKCLGIKSGDEVHSSEDNTEEISLSEIECINKKRKRKRDCVSSNKTKLILTEKSKKQSAIMCNNNSEAESDFKKKKQKKEALIKAEKDSEIMDDSSDEHSLKFISAKTKNRKTNQTGLKVIEMDSNSEEFELVTISQESDADSLPVIVDEIKASEPVCNERVSTSKSRNVNSTSSCFEDEPVIVTEIKYYPIFDQGSSQSKICKPIETELHLDTVAETKAAAENIFFCDAEPTSCITKSCNDQITFDTIHDSEQKDITLCEKSQIINEDLNVSVSLANLQDEKLLLITDSRLNITEKSLTSEEKGDSSIEKSSPLKNGKSQLFLTESVSNFDDESLISKKGESLLSDKQTNINMDSQDCKKEECSVISSNMEERSGHFNQDEEASSIDLAIQPETSNDALDQASGFVEIIRNTKTDLISEKPDDKSVLIEVDSKNETIHGINISQKDIPATEVHVSNTNNNDFHGTNTEMTENNSEVVEKSESKNENSLSCLGEKGKMIQEKIDSDSSINPALSNISVGKFEKMVQITNCSESENEVPSEYSISSLETKSMNLLNTNISSQETVIRKENVAMDDLLNKNDSEMVSNSSSNESLEVENPSTLKDSAGIDTHGPSKDNLIHKVPSHEIPELALEIKSPELKPENSQRPMSKQILEENQNLSIKDKSDKVQTPNSSAANKLMEGMLNLVEQANYVQNKFLTQNVLNLTPTVHCLAQKLLKTSPEDEVSGKSLTFLDLSTESVGSHSENESFTSHASETPGFLKYRDILIDQDDIKSEDTLSENKSISKADTNGYPSDVSSDNDDEENNYLSDCSSPRSTDDVAEVDSKNVNNEIEKHQMCEGTFDEKIKKESQDIVVDNSKIQWLNPVVNLGERCDSEAFILENSIVSPDFSVLTDIRTEEKEINQAHSTDNLKEATPVKCDKIGEVKMDAKIKIQPGRKLDQEMTFSKVKQLSVELTSEKNLSEDQEDISYDKSQELFLSNQSQESDKAMSANGQELTVCNEDQESGELTSEIDLSENQGSTKRKKGQDLAENGKESFMLSLSMRKLRNKPAAANQIRKSPRADEGCSAQNQNSPTTSVRSLRSRNPPASSSQEARNSRSQTVTKRSSKRLKKEVNVNLGFVFSELSLNSPKILRSKSSVSSDKNNSEVVKETDPSTINQGTPCRRSTRASVISSKAETQIKDEDSDPEGYNLRSRKSVIMPGKLKF